MAHRYPRTDSGEIVHSLQFNHDQTVFSCAMEDGVRIFNVEPLVEHTRLRADKVGSIRACYLLNRTNLIALVGGGKRPKFAENSLLIFDDALKEFVLDFTFSSPVVNVKMEFNRLVVVLEHQIHVFTFPREPKKILSLETRPNARGICAISPAPTACGSRILVFPCNKIGTVQAVDLATAGAGITSSPTTVHAHQSDIACLALSADSTLLATASKKGTLIRVFDLVSKKKLVELRRGSDPALLYCINFSPDGDYLCCSADTGTVHIFALKKTSLNRRLAFSKMGLSLGNYAESQWALATFTVPPERACLCGFIDSSNVAAICKDGTYHKYTFNSEGNCTRVAYDIYFDLYDEDDF